MSLDLHSLFYKNREIFQFFYLKIIDPQPQNPLFSDSLKNLIEKCFLVYSVFCRRIWVENRV